MGGMLVTHEPTSAAAVRHRIADDLCHQGLQDDCIEEVVLVASELVGNAVRHASPADDSDLDVTWSVVDSHVLVTVADGSVDAPLRREAAADATSGRGLTIIAALSSDWGVEPLPEGKRVWARIRVH